MDAVVGGSTRWRRNPRALARHAPGCVIVAGIRGYAPLRLDGAAAYIWHALEQPTTETELVAVIAEETRIAPADVEIDARAAVEQLSAIGVIVTDRV